MLPSGFVHLLSGRRAAFQDLRHLLGNPGLHSIGIITHEIILHLVDPIDDAGRRDGLYIHTHRLLLLLNQSLNLLLQPKWVAQTASMLV